MHLVRTTAGLLTTLLLGTAAAVATAPTAGAAEQKGPLAVSDALRRAVTVDGILRHERALQQVADAWKGTRASGKEGYNRSAIYVADQLKRAGYTVRLQPFTFPYFQETGTPTLARVSPDPETYRVEDDFLTLEYSGSGSVQGRLVPTKDVLIPPPAQPGSTSGCEASDFAKAPGPNAVALIQRGTCDFAVKVANAKAAGYAAVIVFNEGQPGRTEAFAGTLGAPVSLPAVGTSYAVGRELYNLTKAGNVTVKVATRTISSNRPTRNLIAEIPTGRTDRVVVVGAHLDSVPEGPGINDNGSGTSTILEIALQMAKLKVKPLNRVKFAFWGAEEEGLLGSTFYVNSLSTQQKRNIDLNLNFDMLGSPNFARFVYDGDGSATPDDDEDAGPTGSDTIEAVFNTYFKQQGLAAAPTAFDGRSDYGPFIEEDIPAGGLFSGAEEIKTAAEQKLFGGTAGKAYDSCYHQACDDIDNLSRTALDQLGDAAAHAVITFAQRSDAVKSLKAAKSAAKSGLPYKGNRLQR